MLKLSLGVIQYTKGSRIRDQTGIDLNLLSIHLNLLLFPKNELGLKMWSEDLVWTFYCSLRVFALIDTFGGSGWHATG